MQAVVKSRLGLRRGIALSQGRVAGRVRKESVRLIVEPSSCSRLYDGATAHFLDGTARTAILRLCRVLEHRAAIGSRRAAVDDKDG